MSSPIAHGLVAVSIFALVSNTGRSLPKIRLPNFSQTLILTVVACLPDIDFLLSLIFSEIKHRGITHSVFFVVVFWFFTKQLFRRKSVYGKQWHVLLTLVLASHILVDLTVRDGVYPTTLQLLWPYDLEFSLNQYLPLLLPINWVTWTLEWRSLPFLELMWVAAWEAAAGSLVLLLTIIYLQLKFYLRSK